MEVAPTSVTGDLVIRGGGFEESTVGLADYPWTGKGHSHVGKVGLVKKS